MTESKYAAPTGHSRHPLWMRTLAVCVVWTIELQPAFAASTIAQQPLFTAPAAPPNVMLMFDDSGSMNLMSLKPDPAMVNPTFTLGTANLPAMKMNTAGYYGISGEKYNFAGNTAYDGRWRHGYADVLLRSPAFNPLAYNPSIQYLPWNDNGVRMPNASYGGGSNVAAGVLTEWDMRNLPPSMGGGTVRSKLVGTKTGWIPASTTTTMPRTLTSTPAGSVRYERLGIGNTPEPAIGADLFTGTITLQESELRGAVERRYLWLDMPRRYRHAVRGPGGSELQRCRAR